MKCKPSFAKFIGEFMSDAHKHSSELAGRYAKALLSLAEEARSVKTVEKDMRSLGRAFAKNPDLQNMVASAIISRDDKSKALLAIAKKGKFSKLVTNFIGTVANNGRAGDLFSMTKAFELMLANKRGVETAIVTSARKLSAAELKSIAGQINKTLGKKVNIEARTDNSLIGGFIVQIGSKYFDASLKTRLEGLKHALKEA